MGGRNIDSLLQTMAGNERLIIQARMEGEPRQWLYILKAGIANVYSPNELPSQLKQQCQHNTRESFVCIVSLNK